MRYKTVIWDLDGTLLDTVEDLCDSVNAALESQGLPTRTLEYTRSVVGHGIADLVHRSMPEGTDYLFDATFAFFKEHYAVNCVNKTRPYDGIPEITEYLKAEGCGQAIVSHKVDSATKMLGKLYFPDTIPVVIGESPTVRKKPAPDSVFEALRQLGAEAAGAVYIGDSEVDITTAANAGLPCVCVSWGFRSRQQLIDGGASLILDSPAALLDYLKGE